MVERDMFMNLPNYQAINHGANPIMAQEIDRSVAAQSTPRLRSFLLFHPAPLP